MSPTLQQIEFEIEDLVKIVRRCKGDISPLYTKERINEIMVIIAEYTISQINKVGVELNSNV